jgi:hypothetical protein
MMLLAGLAMVLCFLWPMRRHVRTLKMPGLLVQFESPNFPEIKTGTPTTTELPLRHALRCHHHGHDVVRSDED